VSANTSVNTTELQSELQSILEHLTCQCVVSSAHHPPWYVTWEPVLVAAGAASVAAFLVLRRVKRPTKRLPS